MRRQDAAVLVLAVFETFPPTPCKAVFMDRSARDRFNAGLRKLRDSGACAGIFRKYQR